MRKSCSTYDSACFYSVLSFSEEEVNLVVLHVVAQRIWPNQNEKNQKEEAKKWHQLLNCQRMKLRLYYFQPMNLIYYFFLLYLIDFQPIVRLFGWCFSVSCSTQFHCCYYFCYYLIHYYYCCYSCCPCQYQLLLDSLIRPRHGCQFDLLR